MKNQTKAYIFAFLAIISWSTVATAFKITLELINVEHMLLFSSFFSLMILFAILLFQNKATLVFGQSKTQYLNSILLGILNPFLYYLILFKVYDMLEAQEAQSLNYTWAIVLSLLCIPILKQKMKIAQLVSLLISFFGVVVIVSRGDILGFQFDNMQGVILAVSSSVIWAFYWVLNMKDDRDEVVKLFLNFFFGFPFIVGYLLCTDQFMFPEPRAILSSLYIGVFEMGLTFFFWIKALTLSKNVAIISNLVYISPFLSLFIISFAIGEDIRLSTIIGLSMIISGILFQQLKK